MLAKLEIEFLDESHNLQWVWLIRRDGLMQFVRAGILGPHLIAHALLTTLHAERYLGEGSVTLRTWAKAGRVGYF